MSFTWKLESVPKLCDNKNLNTQLVHALTVEWQAVEAPVGLKVGDSVGHPISAPMGIRVGAMGELKVGEAVGASMEYEMGVAVRHPVGVSVERRAGKMSTHLWGSRLGIQLGQGLS